MFEMELETSLEPSDLRSFDFSFSEILRAYVSLSVTY